MNNLFQEMAEKWPSAVVSRGEAERFTGGLIGAKYLANLDASGQGPSRFRCGRKVVYSVNEFVKWLEKRSAVIADRNRGAAK